MSANFTPDMVGYKGLSPFRFWCQKTLPLVYDDSLSYYELLCKVVNYINGLITDVAATEENVDRLLTAYNQLQEYVNNYFDGADFQQKIDDSLDRYAEDGTLSAMVNTHVRALLPYEVGQQIGDVVDEQLPPVVDLKLGAVVDTKLPDVVDDKLEDVVRPMIVPAVSGLLPQEVGRQLPDEVETQLPAAIGEDLGTIAPSVIQQWLNDHPDATTSVEDGSISLVKLNTVLQRLARLDGNFYPTEYDPTVTYYTDDMCTYRNTLTDVEMAYKCIATSTTGTFSAADWAVVDENDIVINARGIYDLASSIAPVYRYPNNPAIPTGTIFFYRGNARNAPYGLWRATTDIPAATFVTPSYAERVTILNLIDGIDQLETDVADLKTSFESNREILNGSIAVDFIDKTDITTNGYLEYRSDNSIGVTQSQNYKAIFERPLNGANILALTGKNTSSALYGFPALVFYDSNKSVLTESVIEWSASTYFDYTVVNVPETAVYFSFCGRITDNISLNVFMFYSDSVNKIYAELEERVVRYTTVASMKADTELKSGMCAATYGYAEINDGGGALYRISSTASGVYETLVNGLYAIANIDESSVLNYAGETIEKKIQGFMETATEGKMLDLKGARINITERYVKSSFSRLQYMSISNGHFVIPYEIGGWLSISSTAGYRPPVFINCTFSGGGSLFYEASISFKAIGCIFKNVQIIRHGNYVQDIQLNGCNVTCLVQLDDNDGDYKTQHAYFIDAEHIIAGYFNNCSFETENRGIIHASSGVDRASLTAFTIQGCVIEGIPSYDIIESHGIRDLRVLDTYVEKVGYFIYDTVESNSEFRMSLINCHIDNRQVGSKYFIYTDATQPKLIATGNYYLRNDDQFICNFDNNAHVVGDHNLFNGKWLYGYRVTEENPFGVAEYNSNNFRATGRTFIFKTLINVPEQPQAFIVVVQKTDTTIMTVYQEVYLLTLTYSSATGYSVEVTPIKENENMTEGDRISWTAIAGLQDAVTITGTTENIVSIAMTNLGSMYSGIASPGLTATN